VVTAVDAGPPPTITVDILGDAPIRYLTTLTPAVNDVVWLVQNDSDAVAVGVLASAAAAALLPQEDFETANDTSTSTTYVGGTTHGIAFVGPPSGIVRVTFEGWIGSNSVVIGMATPASRMSDHVRTGATIGSGSDELPAADDRSIPYFNPITAAGFKYTFGSYTHLVTGLTAGSDYNVVTVFKDVTTAASAAVNDRRIVVDPVT
jgi:hypothetical protein